MAMQAKTGENDEKATPHLSRDGAVAIVIRKRRHLFDAVMIGRPLLEANLSADTISIPLEIRTLLALEQTVRIGEVLRPRANHAPKRLWRPTLGTN
jgi:hypothetical protein